jgi:hypothetical protein
LAGTVQRIVPDKFVFIWPTSFREEGVNIHMKKKRDAAQTK